MTPERWQQVKEVLQHALECAPQERDAFLAEACTGDEALRAEIESLLASYEQAGSFIAAPAVADAAELLDDSSDDSLLGQRIGPYQVIRQIGRGGMGAVYLATRADDQYRKQVAIKLVKRGMDTDFILSRFRHERQILASLDHPGISKLLDGGTTEDGRPYFVMEHIEGLPITEYGDAHRLPTGERLQLFRAVCSAMHYAHQNLIVHRDIKPSNILVTADGTPKLLDFGIAKIFNPEIAASALAPTAPAVRMMTPEYASPEQVRGAAITTASDVYSLGVVLYELLTGHRPYRVSSHAPHELARVICEQEPEKPSTAVIRVEEVTQPDSTVRLTLTPELVSKLRDGQPDKLRRRLKGDLDNIILMAMRKEPARRYASVEQFSEDIRRHLAGLPVIARKDTLTYRSAKFIQRHTAGVAAAALVALALLAGIIATTRQAQVAERERAKAEQRFQEVRELANSVLFEFHDAIEKLPGSTPARELLVKRALRYLDRLNQEAQADLSLQRELAAAYQKVGDVQGRPGFAHLGDQAGALASYRKALQLREALAAAEPANLEFQRELATNHDRIGDVLRLSGNTTGAIEHYRQALAPRQTLAAADPANLELKRELALSFQRLGDMLGLTGNPKEALEQQRQGLALLESLVASDPANAKARRDLFISLIKTGDRLAATGDSAGALSSYRRGLAISAALSAADALNAQARRELAISHDKVGNALTATNDHAGALQHYQQALAIRQALAASDPANAEYRRDLATSHDKIGRTRAVSGDLTGALSSYRRALALDEAAAAADPANAQARLDVSTDYENIGEVLAKTTDLTGAREHYRKSLAIREEASKADPANAEVRHDLAAIYAKLGRVCALMAAEVKLAMGKQAEHWREARSWYQQSLNVFSDLRARGVLRDSQAATPDQITSEIAKCDAALAKLKGPSVSVPNQ
jgi:serine/threonine protein kinase/predicted negative regulator of RcsB-dependent stress response